MITGVSDDFPPVDDSMVLSCLIRLTVSSEEFGNRPCALAEQTAAV